MYRKSLISVLFLIMAGYATTKPPKKPALSPLGQFLQRIGGGTPGVVTKSAGSLWPQEGGALTNLAAYYKARALNDLVIIRIVEQTLAQASGTVNAQRTFAADSGISGLAGQTNTANVDPLYALHSSSNLKGSGTANSQSQLRTSITGRVVALLPNGNMVIEAEHQVSFNQESQILVLRGLIRPNDISSDNSVPSTMISDLEIEMKGKGVVSDSTHQPNLFVRLLMKILGW